jgi:DNA-binding CsgD family transcriptional regulator
MTELAVAGLDRIDIPAKAPAAAGDSELTLEQAEAELAQYESRAVRLRAELNRTIGRSDFLRRFVADALYARAAELLREADRNRAERLTDVEAEWARLYATTTLTLDQIARRKGVSPNTGKSHLKKVFQKLRINSRQELVIAWRAARHVDGGAAGGAASQPGQRCDLVAGRHADPHRGCFLQ